MLELPKQLTQDYCSHLVNKGIKHEQFVNYLKWLRYFMDFCEKHHVGGSGQERLRQFINKLKDKGQTEDQRRKAYHAVSLYFGMQTQKVADMATADTGSQTGEMTPASAVPRHVSTARVSQYSEVGYQEASSSAEWDAVIRTMANEITVRHYSRKTLKTYAHWSRQFQRFLKDKPPEELTGDDVKEYLTHLAATRTGFDGWL